MGGPTNAFALDLSQTYNILALAKEASTSNMCFVFSSTESIYAPMFVDAMVVPGGAGGQQLRDGVVENGKSETATTSGFVHG
jgi:hypothetical protein